MDDQIAQLVMVETEELLCVEISQKQFNFNTGQTDNEPPNQFKVTFHPMWIDKRFGMTSVVLAKEAGVELLVTGPTTSFQVGRKYKLRFVEA